MTIARSMFKGSKQLIFSSVQSDEFVLLELRTAGLA